MREGPKTVVALLVVLLLALALAACGGDDSSSSTQAEAGGQTQSSSDASKQSDAKDRAKGKSASDDSEGGGQSDGSGGSSNFVPKKHNDSGGGSQQFKVKEGDNSVQEFGTEAESSEFDQAAAALHNFLDARADRNWAAACEYLSAELIASFEKLAAQAKQINDKSCGGVLEKLTNPAAKQAIKAEAAQADVGSLRIEGERAFVIYTDAEGTVFAMPMADEDGTWKVASLAGTPLS